jgi:curved DNA-binding protein CbpA
MNLYTELGVKPGATAAEVKKAFRAKAKRTHPDRGGTAEAFDKVVRANLVLSDAARRAKYDETGEIDEANLDRQMQAVLNIIANAFETALVEITSKGKDPGGFNMLTSMKADLNRKMAQAKAMQRDGLTLLGCIEKIAGRFSTKGKTNHVEAQISCRIADIRRRLAQSDEGIRQLEAAAELLAGYTYRLDREVPTYATPLGFVPLGVGRVW